MGTFLWVLMICIPTNKVEDLLGLKRYTIWTRSYMFTQFYRTKFVWNENRFI